MKKFLAIVLSIVMVLSMAVMVNADETVLREGDVEITTEADWWDMRDMSAEILGDDIASISKIVFTTDSNGVIITYSGKQITDAAKDSHWTQSEAITEYTINGADIFTEDHTDADGNHAPYVFIVSSNLKGTEVKVHWAVYGEAAAAEAEAEAEAPAEEAAAEEPAAEEPAAEAPAEEPAAEAPAAEEPAAEAPAAEAPAAEAPAAEAPAKAPSTGLALAVIPAAIALAAACVTKKH